MSAGLGAPCQCATSLSYEANGVTLCAFCDLPKAPTGPDLARVTESLLRVIAVSDEIVQLAEEIMARPEPEWD